MKWSHGSGDELHSYSFYFVMRTSCTLNSNFYFVFQQARAEQEEEYISNTLLKKIQALKKEKETLAMNYEQEEEYLTNDLSRKLMQVSEALTGEVGHINGLVQGRRNSIALAMELRLACINLPIYSRVGWGWGGGGWETSTCCPGSGISLSAFVTQCVTHQRRGGGTTWWHVVPNDVNGESVPLI